MVIDIIRVQVGDNLDEVLNKPATEQQVGRLGCFKIAPLSNFLTAQQISDGVLAADYEFDIIFYL